MLDLKFKECCRECRHVSVNHTTMVMRSVTDYSPQNCVKVYCEHATVCKAYLESDVPWYGQK